MSLKRCSVAGNSCRLTTDRRQLDVSDAVVFHFRNKSFDRLPTCRRSNQRYVYLNFDVSKFKLLRYQHNIQDENSRLVRE